MGRDFYYYGDKCQYIKQMSDSIPQKTTTSTTITRPASFSIIQTSTIGPSDCQNGK